MKCIIITIGDEILAGKTVDSNSSWLSRELNAIGIDVSMTLAVPDDVDIIAEELLRAIENTDIVIMTGGLGPTDDDMTREAIAKALSIQLHFDEKYFETIRGIFAERGIVMPENVRREAFVPDSAEILENGVGVAPGLFLRVDRKILVALPGVPPEMKDIFENRLRPILSSMAGDIKWVEKFYTTGLPESVMFDKLLESLGNLGTAGIGSYPSNLGVEVRFTITQSDCFAEEKLRRIKSVLAPWCFSREEKNLPALIGGLLKEERGTLSTAESCTGGLVASRIVDLSGASAWFNGGAVVYSNEAKADILGVSREDINRCGAVEAIIAKQMAEGAKRVFNTDYALATTGISGPEGGTPQKPVGTVFYAVATPQRTLVRENRFTRGREDHRWRTSQAVLAMLWLELEGIYDNHPWEDGSEAAL